MTNETKLRCKILYYPFMHTDIDTENIILLAKLCYNPLNVDRLDSIIHTNDPERNKVFIRNLIRSGHMGALEHWNTTFAVEGYSRVSSQQNSRHRLIKMLREPGVCVIADDAEQDTADVSQLQQSQRYVAETNFKYVIPDSFRQHPDYLQQYIALQQHIQQMQMDGLALGLPPEDVRYALTNATETRFVITTNARQLRHMFNLRCCNRAQWEIRKLFNSLLAEYCEIAPNIFWNAGPSCRELGYCPEGVHGCGSMPLADK